MSIEESYDEKLVYMVNQIAKNLATQGEAAAAKATADHLKKFWDPRMRTRILAHLAAGGAGLEPAARAAIEHLGGGPQSPRGS